MKPLAVIFCVLLGHSAAQPDLAVDLKDLETDPSNLPESFEWVSPLTTAGPECRGQGVLKATFDKDERRRLEINLEYSDVKGVTLDIGDSETNTGSGGDAGTQSNNAEFVIKDNTIFLYGKEQSNPDYYWSLLHERQHFVLPGSRIIINVSDGKVTADGGFSSTVLQTYRSFALRGQPDKKGDVNYDIYIGLNRAVGRNDTTGVGLCAAYFTWQEQP